CRYDGMVAHVNLAEQLGARAELNVAPKRRDSARTLAERNLLEDDAIWTDNAIGVNDDAVGMGNHESAANRRPDRNIGPGHRRPEAVTDHRPLAGYRSEWPARTVALVAADR